MRVEGEEPPDAWEHVVLGDGDDAGMVFLYRWGSRSSRASTSGAASTRPTRSSHEDARGRRDRGNVALAGSTAGSPRLAGCPAFPADNPWNQRVDRLPVARGSAAIVGSIGADTALHPDFGSGLWDGAPIGIPFTTVRAGPPQVACERSTTPTSRTAARTRSRERREDRGRRRPARADRRPSTCTLYELYALRAARRRLDAGSGAIWSLRSNRLRPAGWTSADAAGLPIVPGLARWTRSPRATSTTRCASRSSARARAYVYPARHYASDLSDPNLPPMGLRVRLRADFPIAGFPARRASS